MIVLLPQTHRLPLKSQSHSDTKLCRVGVYQSLFMQDLNETDDLTVFTHVWPTRAKIWIIELSCHKPSNSDLQTSKETESRPAADQTLRTIQSKLGHTQDTSFVHLNKQDNYFHIYSSSHFSKCKKKRSSFTSSNVRICSFYQFLYLIYLWVLVTWTCHLWKRAFSQFFHTFNY